MTSDTNKQETILAIDSSLGACSVAILKNNLISAYYEELSASNQAKELLPMVQKALASSNTTYSQLSVAACSVGPGSFTGIRIGLASARAIGFAAKIPVLGFNSLMVMAMGSLEVGANAPIVSVLNAGKGESIYQSFSDTLEPLCAPTLVAQHLAPSPTRAISFPRADWLATLASTYPNYAVSPVPFYVRPPDAKLPQESKN